MPRQAIVEKISWKCTSNDSGANCRVRAGLPSRGCDACQVIRFASGRAPIATPFGLPVEPEVNST